MGSALLRVPLFIHHPQSPFQGQHYKYPTESIDIYATLNELLKLPQARESLCNGVKCKPLQGKSLGPVLLGPAYEKLVPKSTNLLSHLKSFLKPSSSDVMPVLDHNFAISQAVRCAPKHRLPKDHVPYRLTGNHKSSEHSHKAVRQHYWQDCDVADKREDGNMFTTLGYSMRTPEYRYTVYFHFNRTTQLPELDKLPFEEELYDHKNETLADFTHREIYNLGVRSLYGPIMDSLRKKLVQFIREKVQFGDH